MLNGTFSVDGSLISKQMVYHSPIVVQKYLLHEKTQSCRNSTNTIDLPTTCCCSFSLSSSSFSEKRKKICNVSLTFMPIVPFGLFTQDFCFASKLILYDEYNGLKNLQYERIMNSFSNLTGFYYQRTLLLLHITSQIMAFQTPEVL